VLHGRQDQVIPFSTGRRRRPLRRERIETVLSFARRSVPRNPEPVTGFPDRLLVRSGAMVEPP
jgi:hypothetical protein